MSQEDRKLNSNIQMYSERLILRNVELADVEQVFQYANNFKIADMMNGSIPYPYSKDLAVQWIRKHSEDSILSHSISWAIAKREDNKLIGSIQIRINQNAAYLSFWLGEPFWHEGYVYEACKKIIQFTFERLNIEKIEAESFRRNCSSRAVLFKLGFEHQDSVIKIEKLFQREEIFDFYCLKNLNLPLS